VAEGVIPGASIMVTGASGFVGSAVVCRLAADGHRVHATARRELGGLPDAVRTFRVGDLDAHTDWANALEGVETVVHAAARVHVMRETARDALGEFRRVNVEGTGALALQALRAGVRRIVYISSIKVNGEATLPGAPFRPDDPPAPSDPYGISKQEAEAVLAGLPGLEVVVIRPVLVYGPGVKGNFLSMVRWVDRRVPLPFGAVHNRRSLVSLTSCLPGIGW
jgi:nucleoside-diphosphate-sugar epimerase